MMRYLPLILVAVLFIYGLIDCLRSDPADVRSIPKPAWIIVILLLPVIGVLLWFFLGRPQYARTTGSGYSAPKSSQAPRTLAPDDDPAFLRNLEISRNQKAEAERLRQLKADLEAREAQLKKNSEGEAGTDKDQ